MLDMQLSFLRILGFKGFSSPSSSPFSRGRTVCLSRKCPLSPSTSLYLPLSSSTFLPQGERLSVPFPFLSRPLSKGTSWASRRREGIGVGSNSSPKGEVRRGLGRGFCFWKFLTNHLPKSPIKALKTREFWTKKYFVRKNAKIVCNLKSLNLNTL